MNVTMSATLGERLCLDILSTAFEGGIGYWAIATNIARDAEGNYAAITLEDAEGEEDWSHLVDCDAIHRGIQAVFDELRGTKVHRNLLTAVINDDAGDIDADDADAIVQMACFGDVVYG